MPVTKLRLILASLLAVGLSLLAAPARAELEATQPPVDFSRDIRPILLKQCAACHGGIKRKGGVSFSSADDAMKPASSGERAIVPGQPHNSELLKRLTTNDPDERMPADGKTLTPAQIELFRRWIEQGAKWPRHWSFEPIRRPPVPAVRNSAWIRNEIDAFVLARLEDKGITPSAEANKRVLIRRLYLDLLGLLPAPAEVEQFLADASPNAYEALVDRLLASPHFGERWGRHWLDLARYADTDGYEVDGARPNAWYWRDWVIGAINDDMPFDRFTIEQIAGDLLPAASNQQKLATAFHRQTLTNKEGGIDKEEYRVYAVMDRVATTSTVWLGLTMACAQCHGHPYDPFSHQDYYQLFAIFNNADEEVIQRNAPRDAMAAYDRAKAEHQDKLESLQERLNEAPSGERVKLENEIKELEKKTPKPPGLALDVIAERKTPRQTYILDRGNFLEPKKDEPVKPGVLTRLHPFQPRSTTADRLDLANWLIDPANPLTRRVAVNHLWQHLFGAGLTPIPDDLGMSGEPPTHPDLLDWLAEEFLARGWSRKATIRLIVTSATYRQSSQHRPDLHAIDPTNQLLHRQNRVRVPAEIVRDLHLDASGLLSKKIGGPSVFPPIPPDLMKLDFRSDLKWVVSEGEDRYRRGMYTFFKRTLPDPNLIVFDCPDASAANVKRSTSNTPLQALATMNNEVYVEAAQALGRRLMAAGKTDKARIEAAFAMTLSRKPTVIERQHVMKLLESSRAHYSQHDGDARQMLGKGETAVAGAAAAAEAASWVAVAGVVLNLDEFVTRE